MKTSPHLAPTTVRVLSRVLLAAVSSTALFSTALLSTALVGCGDDTETAGTPATGDDVTAGTNSDDTSSMVDCDANPTAAGCGSSEPAALCTSCTTDADCGSGYCAKDARGDGICTRRCNYTGELQCESGYFCKQLGNQTDSFYCYPIDGVCEADGADCSPCTNDDDCQDELQCVEASAGVRFCARQCADDSVCPSTMGCGESSLLTGNYCFPRVGGVPQPRCGGRPLGFCESCRTDAQCGSGICYESDSIGQMCSSACTKQEDCPSGTFCISSQNVCAPPIAYGCQGFLGCLGVECPSGQLCYQGFCIDEP